MPLSSALWMAAVTLWILDASVNVSMGPFRALVPDLLPESQVTLGYIIQAITIAIGTVTASALPWILQNIFHVSSGNGNIPLVVRWSFGSVRWSLYFLFYGRPSRRKNMSRNIISSKTLERNTCRNVERHISPAQKCGI